MKKIIFILVITLITSILVISQSQFKGNVQVRGNGGAGKHGGFSIPSSFTWEQVPSTPEFVISIAEVGTKLFAGTRSAIPTTYLGGMYKLESGSWSKLNAGLSARISICNDWPSPCSSAPGGTFTLSYNGQTTNAISTTASNSTIQTELTSLSTIGSGNLVVSDGPLGQSATLTFQGARANDDPTNITMNSSGLTGSTPGGMIRGPRFIAQLFTTPTNALLALIRNNSATELFRLVSGATTWQKVTGIGTPALIFDYTSDASGNLLLADTTTTNNIWRSTDDGVSWSTFSTISTACITGGGADPRPIAIYRAATSIAPNNTIFTAAHNDGLHYSTDSGATWNCIGIDNTLPIGGGSFIRTNSSGQPMFGGEFGGFFLHTGLLSSPTWTYQDSGYFTANAETVHDLIKLNNNDLIIHAKRPYRSTDGGVTWTLDDNGLPAGDINNFDVVGGMFSVCSHTITIGTDKKLYMAVVNQLSGWGIYRTTVAVVP